MKQSVFEYRDYKSYLTDWIESQPSRGHGCKSRIALAAGCNSAYVTQVLSKNAQFSFEQAEKISRFLGHHREEVIYFQLLVQFARAGTPALRQLLSQQLEQAVDSHFNLKARLKFKRTLDTEDQATYYSAWYYSAIHASLSLKTLQTKEALARYFGLSISVVSEVLRFLVTVGLVKETRGRYETGVVSIHLGKDSPMIARHHTNWRMRSISALEDLSPNHLHYSSAVTISKADEPRIRAILVGAIKEIREIVANSPEEGAYCYNVDFFGLER